jgi:hypothetical protein
MNDSSSKVSFRYILRNPTNLLDRWKEYISQDDKPLLYVIRPNKVSSGEGFALKPKSNLASKIPEGAEIRDDNA